MSVQMISVTSSHIDSISWEDNILYIKYNNGSTYKYLDVPEVIFRGLKDTNSVGTYFYKNIKDIYKEEKV